MIVRHYMWITSLTGTRNLDVLVEAGHSDKQIAFPVSNEMGRKLYVGQKINVNINLNPEDI